MTASRKCAPLVPLNKTRLYEEIVEQLKDRIIRGDFPPESRLPPERELAEQLAVNRTTVREALHKLEGLGLVEIKHGNGIFVKDYRESGSLELAKHILFMDGRLNLEVLKDLMDLRRILVPEISYYAALNRGEADLQDLERIVWASPDMPMEEKDWRVHNLIARASGNHLFVILLNSFTDLAGRLSNLYFLSPDNCRRSVKFYQDIFAAIKAGNPGEAREIMKDVLVYAERQTLTALGSAR
jgi:GntR family transcriptional regulator, transcriptional repressor for pyruvate dehydrogenase complex